VSIRHCSKQGHRVGILPVSSRISTLAFHVVEEGMIAPASSRRHRGRSLRIAQTFFELRSIKVLGELEKNQVFWHIDLHLRPNPSWKLPVFLRRAMCFSFKSISLLLNSLEGILDVAVSLLCLSSRESRRRVLLQHKLVHDS